MIYLNRDGEPRDPDNEGSVIAKWAFDGVSSLPDLVLRLREYADRASVLADEGWAIVDPIDGGMATIRKGPVKPGPGDEDDDGEGS